MDSDCAVSADGHEVAHQNGVYKQSPTLGDDFVVLDSDDDVTAKVDLDGAAPNGNQKVFVKMDNGLTNSSSSEDAKDWSNSRVESNGLPIAKVKSTFSLYTCIYC